MTRSSIPDSVPLVPRRGKGVWWILALGLPLGVVAMSTPLPAVLALGGILGLTALLLLAAFLPARLADVIYFAALASSAVPLDKYFAYQPHVGGWPAPRFALADIFFLLLGALAFLAWLIRRARPFLPWALCIPYGLLLAQYAVSLLFAPRQDLALFELTGAVHAICVAAVIATLFRRRHFNVVMGAIAALVFLHTSFALIQSVTGKPIGAGLMRQHTEVMKEELSTGAVRLRPSGLFDHPIMYADFILLSLPILAAGMMTLRGRLPRLMNGAALLTGVLGLLLTLSRGAWISSLLMAVLFVGLGIRRGLLKPWVLRRLAIVTLAVGLVLGVAFGPAIYERLAQSQAGNTQVRLDLNGIALAMVREHPFTGIGLNNFVTVMQRYDPKNVMRYFPAPVHNLYLLEAAEAGLPALFFFLASGAGLLFWSLRRLPVMKEETLQWLALAVISGLAGFALSQLADFSHRLEPLRTFVWTLVGILVGALRIGLTPEAGKERMMP